MVYLSYCKVSLDQGLYAHSLLVCYSVDHKHASSPIIRTLELDRLTYVLALFCQGRRTMKQQSWEFAAGARVPRWLVETVDCTAIFNWPALVIEHNRDVEDLAY